ncbi:MAG: zinc ribbon domain-containing protein [Thermoguttaceae bacterium]
MATIATFFSEFIVVLLDDSKATRRIRPVTDYRDFEEPGDELNDWEYPDEEDDEPSETRPCPHCSAEIYEDAELCPVCGQFIVSGGSNPWLGRSAWWILLGLLGVGAVLWVLLAGRL